MADSRCCFGCSNVRKCAWVISIFDMLICILLTIQCVSAFKFSSYSSYSSKKLHVTSGDNSGSYNSNQYDGYRHLQSIENDFIIFTQLFILFLFFYINLNLKKATFIHNAQIINQWLVINSIFFIFFFLYVCFTTIINGNPEVIPIGIPVSIVVVYQIYVVKCFYDDELKYLASSERNATQSTMHMHGPPYVTITSQTTAYPVQSGPYVIQQVHQPVSSAPYPQQTYQYQLQPEPPQSHIVLPPTELPHPPQEYCNPPPYSPNYSMQEGPSMKQ